LKHGGKEEAEESKTLPLMNTDDTDLKKPFAADLR
jgi:hypothetical protein